MSDYDGFIGWMVLGWTLAIGWVLYWWYGHGAGWGKRGMKNGDIPDLLAKGDGPRSPE
jgi:hypothetical protein